MTVEAQVLREGPVRRTGRPLLDVDQPSGFIRYPYYTVREVALVLSISEDFVRALFRSRRQGCILEIFNPRPGKRVYRTLLIPYQTLMAFINRHTAGESSPYHLAKPQRGIRAGHVR
jgi:hypothetical protein